EIKPIRSNLGISIISTSKGIMTGKQARKLNIGGEVLCIVY
ncbi:MAG: 30S ribosomal protein S8, partial [Leptospira sp.]|nr:30S ribosomal protein S8 [Leptospira sp.]